MPSTLIDEYRKVRKGQLAAATETGQRCWGDGAAATALQVARTELALQQAERDDLIRFEWVADDDYRPEHSGDPVDGDKWLAEETAKLASGEWEALGCIAFVPADPAKCPQCNQEIEATPEDDGYWHSHGSLWGIVIDASDRYDYKREVERELAVEAGVIS